MDNLLKFPQSTVVDKLIPKSKFVKASDTPTAVRDLLAKEFEQIRLLYVLRADTLNVESGSEVSEIDVFYFRSKQDSYSINPFCALDNLIPRHTLYIIEYGGRFDLLMQHKRRTIVAGLPKWTREVSQLQQDININTFGLRIEGMNLDRVYFNLLSQLSGYRVENSDSLKEIKALEEEIAKRAASSMCTSSLRLRAAFRKPSSASRRSPKSSAPVATSQPSQTPPSSTM